MKIGEVWGRVTQKVDDTLGRLPKPVFDHLPDTVVKPVDSLWFRRLKEVGEAINTLAPKIEQPGGLGAAVAVTMGMERFLGLHRPGDTARLAESGVIMDKNLFPISPEEATATETAPACTPTDP